jgi:hypothetical protein
MPRIRSAKKSDESGVSCEAILFDASRVITVGQDSPVWVDGEVDWRGWKGAFVRLVPPRDGPGGLVDEVVGRIKFHGAAAVKIVRPQKDGTVVEPKLEPVTMTARTVVFRMAEECRTRDRGALLRVLGAAMDREGM